MEGEVKVFLYYIEGLRGKFATHRTGLKHLSTGNCSV